mgnify:CR=1 FL=1
MVLWWHVIALVPICFPLSEDWESWFNIKENMVCESLCVGGTNISNIIGIVKSVNILWKFRSHAANSVSSRVRVDLWLIVHSWELTVNASCIVVKVVVLINCDVAPLWDKDISLGLSKSWKRMIESEHDLNLLECHGFNIFVWSVGDTFGIKACGLLTLIMNINLVDIIDRHGSRSWIDT